MKTGFFVASSLLAILGCSSARTLAPLVADASYTNLPTAVRSTPRESNKPKFGPPPPGYERIVGEPVPDWSPADMQFPERGGVLQWAPLGPRPILFEYWSGTDDASGRVVSIAPHPFDPNTVYIASASGGIWKTTDAGTNWTPITDELSILNHGAVNVAPGAPSVITIGTGEYTTGSTGDGVFRSYDAGVTWLRLATANQAGNTCSGLLVDPSDVSIIHLTGSSGYVRSIDNGATWQNTLTGACSSLAMNPSNPDVLYVGRHSDTVYKSVDGGASWSPVSTGLPGSDVRRIVLAISTSNPQTLYCAIVNSSNGLRGFYKTTNGGASWTQLTSTPNFPSPQGFYDVFVGVDPTNANIVYCGGVDPRYAPAGVIKSTNGGASWTEVSAGALGGQLHPDHHAIAFGPDGTVWCGNDGGVWKSLNGGQRWINCNATLTVTQNYTAALHPTDVSQVMTGTQDNGTLQRVDDELEWPQLVSGDGGFLAYDANNPSRRYTTYVYLTVFRITDSAFDDISGPWSGDSRNFIAPLVMDPNDSRTLLGGTIRVWRTTDADTNANWTAISPNIGGGGTLNAIAVAQGASNTIYTGSTTGRLYVTTDSATWTRRDAGLPASSISDIVIDPADPGTAYVSYFATTGGRVYRTSNYGVNWTNVTGSLPSGAAARALAIDWRFDPPLIIVGSGAGVYCSFDNGANWEKDGADLPNVNIGDLQIDTANNVITAATYGRGAWQAALPPVSNPDLDGDGCVGFGDFALLSANWGPGNPGGDITGDGNTDFDDFAALSAAWGQGCP